MGIKHLIAKISYLLSEQKFVNHMRVDRFLLKDNRIFLRYRAFGNRPLIEESVAEFADSNNFSYLLESDKMQICKFQLLDNLLLHTRTHKEDSQWLLDYTAQEIAHDK